MEKLPEQQKSNRSEASLILSERVQSFLVALADVNDLIVFPIDTETAIRWAQEVERLVPGTTPEKLRFLMDCFKTEQLIWDNKKGIQNILVSLKYIREKEDGGYKLLNWPV